MAPARHHSDGLAAVCARASPTPGFSRRSSFCSQTSRQRRGTRAAWLRYGNAFPHGAPRPLWFVRATGDRSSRVGVGYECRCQRPGLRAGDSNRYGVRFDCNSALRSGGVFGGGHASATSNRSYQPDLEGGVASAIIRESGACCYAYAMRGIASSSNSALCDSAREDRCLVRSS